MPATFKINFKNLPNLLQRKKHMHKTSHFYF